MEAIAGPEYADLGPEVFANSSPKAAAGGGYRGAPGGSVRQLVASPAPSPHAANVRQRGGGLRDVLASASEHKQTFARGGKHTHSYHQSKVSRRTRCEDCGVSGSA